MFKKRANLKICVILFLICINLFFWDSVFADVPQQVFFQARVKKKDGATISGSHSVTLRLYSASTGGSALWTETQTLTADADGIISCYLGSTTSFPSTIDFNSTYYLSMDVDSDGEMSGRIKIVPALSALNSDRFDGLDSLQFLRSDTSDTMDGTLGITGNLGAGITSPSARLDIRSSGTSTGFALRIADSTPTDRLVVLDNGNVGIGLTNPIARLHVYGSGNVGIGTTLPTTKLQVYAATTAPSATLSIIGSGTGAGLTGGLVLKAADGTCGYGTLAAGTGPLNWLAVTCP